MVALKAVALEHFHAGRLLEALQPLQEIIERYDPTTHRNSAEEYGHDTLVAALCYQSWALSLSDFLIGPSRQPVAALKWATDLCHPNTKGYAYHHGSLILSLLLRNVSAVQQWARETIEHGDRLRLNHWSDDARISQGWALAQLGRKRAATGKIEEGIALRQARGSASNRFDGLWLTVAAEGQLHAGRWEAASAALSEAFEKSKRTHDLPWVANLHCARSHISLHGPLQSRELAEQRSS